MFQRVINKYADMIVRIRMVFCAFVVHLQQSQVVSSRDLVFSPPFPCLIYNTHGFCNVFIERLRYVNASEQIVC